MSNPSTESVVICGGGIIGLSTAHYLSSLSPSASITVLDTSSELPTSASARGAGFLAKDWFPPATASLGALSFRLHKELAATNDGLATWGYSPSRAFSISDPSAAPGAERGEDWLLSGTSRANAAGDADDIDAVAGLPAWLAPALADVISTTKTTAQVDPAKLCAFLLDQCTARGVQIIHPATPVSVTLASSSGAIKSIAYTTPDSTSPTTIPCTALVLSAGVWTPAVHRTLFPAISRTLPITPLSGHSLVLRSPHWSSTANPSTSSPTVAPPHCVAAFAPPSATHPFAPEIFSRAHGDIYLAGLNSSALSITSDVPDPAAIASLRASAAHLFGVPDSDLDIVRGALCHRPVGPGGKPIVTRLSDAWTGSSTARVFLAAGHGPWGISMSLGTGFVVAELVLDREPSADLSALTLSLS